MSFPFLVERFASREWDLEQRCFNGRNISKVLDRGKRRRRIIRGEDPRESRVLAASLEGDMKESGTQRGPKRISQRRKGPRETFFYFSALFRPIARPGTVSAWKTVYLLVTDSRARYSRACLPELVVRTRCSYDELNCVSPKLLC